MSEVSEETQAQLMARVGHCSNRAKVYLDRAEELAVPHLVIDAAPVIVALCALVQAEIATANMLTDAAQRAGL